MPNVTAVVLAAGDSRRMGYPKALLPWRGSTFVGTIAARIVEAGLRPPLIVLGRHASAIRPHVPKGAASIVNPDPDRGQLSSLQLAIAQAGASCDGIMIWPVDQPGVSTPLVRGLVSLFEAADVPLVFPVCCGRRGHPAIIGQALFVELMQLDPSASPKPVFQRHSPNAVLLDTAETACIEDVDTPEDYLRAAGVTLEEALRDVR